MGKHRAWLAVVLGACGPGAKATEPPANEAKLCVDPAAPGGAEIPLGYEDPPGMVDDALAEAVQPALEDGWAIMGATTAGAVTYALLYADGCAGGGCDPDPRVVRIADGKITHTVEPPAKETIVPGGDYPFVIDWMLVRGGAVWLGYNIHREPDTPEAWMTRGHVAVFGLEDLALRWTTVISSWPAEDTGESCGSSVFEVDADCDGDLDLVQQESCIAAHCVPPDEPEADWVAPQGCPEAPTESNVVHAQGADHVYTRKGG